MPKRLLATLVAVPITLAGCSASAASPSDSVNNPPAAQDAESSTPTAEQAAAEPANAIHPLGETVDTPGGSSVTAYDYRVITTPGDDREGVLEVKVCVGDPVEGYSGSSVLTELWSIEDAEDRRFEAASSYGENDEVAPILSYESNVAWNDCIRGWIVMDTDDSTDAQTIRYFNSMAEQPGIEEIRWELP